MGQQEGGGGAPEGASAAVRPISVELVVEVLRGVAQVDFVRSAVCGLFFVAALFAAGWSAAYAVLGAAAATVPAPALGAIAAPFGGHAFTWPFVLTTMLFLAAVPVIPRSRRV
ncbi:urea transporter [Kitasatospora aureofaciens]|uniref:urea transporter n=1 Tax=Kitasatospora aureofaciens TaxID=1894 RepID=UPI0036F4A5A9